MAKATLTKNTLTIRYQNGVTESGDPKFTTQKFSRIKLTATDESILEVGQALGNLLDVDNADIYKEENFILEEEI